MENNTNKEGLEINKNNNEADVVFAFNVKSGKEVRELKIGLAKRYVTNVISDGGSADEMLIIDSVYQDAYHYIARFSAPEDWGLDDIEIRAKNQYGIYYYFDNICNTQKDWEPEDESALINAIKAAIENLR